MNRFIIAIKKPALWPWLIALPGIILRVWAITASPLWYDERFTQLIAGLPLDRLLVATAGDVHPPAYYLMVKSWTWLFGNTPLALRLFSALFSALSLYTFWMITGEMDLPNPARLVALAVMTYHPSQIYYAQEARMYTLLQELVLSQWLAMLRGNWSWFGVYTLLSISTHNFGLIYSPVIAGLGALREMRVYKTVPWRIALCLILSVTAWWPWSATLHNQMTTIAGGYWIQPVTVGSVLESVINILAGLHIDPDLAIATIFAISVGLGLLVVAGVRLRRWDLLWLAMGPVALVVAGSLAWRPILLFRGFLAIIPPLAILAGLAIFHADLRGNLVAGALVFPLAVCLVFSIGANQAGMAKTGPYLTRPKTDAPIVHLDDTTMILFGEPGVDYLLDAGCPAEGGALTRQTREALGFETIKLGDLPDRYIFAGTLTPLSTACHEMIYKQMLASGRVLYQTATELGAEGIVSHDQ